MSPATRVAAVGVVVVLLVLAAVRFGQGRQDTFLASDGDLIVWDVLRDEVVAVEVWRPGGRWGLVQRDGAWEVDAGEGTPADADPAAVRRLLDALEETRRGVAAGGASLEATGLDDAARVIVVRSGGRIDRLEVGDAAPVGGRTYVRRSDGQVVAVRSPLRDAIAEPPIP